MKVKEILKVVEGIAPPYLGVPKDNIGLQLGDPEAEVETVLLALELSEAVLEDADTCGAQLVITHHPLIYRPLTSIDCSTAPGAMIESALKRRLAVISAHTNLDAARHGVNDTLAHLAGVVETRALLPSSEHTLFKLTTFVPENDLEAVRRAICLAGGGEIGEYRFCTFRARGIGSFMGSEDSSPAIGEPGSLEEVDEFRLEVVVGRDRLDDVIQAMKRAHSYEEVAYDVYPLRNTQFELGLGRIGRLRRPATVEEFARHIKEVLAAPYVLVEGDAEREVKTVAVLAGSGGSALNAAVRAGADLFLTGELGYHDALNAAQEGLAVVAAGHYCTEQPAMHVLEEMLAERIPDVNITLGEGGAEPYWTL